MNEFKGAPGPWDLGTPEIQGNGLHIPVHSESHGELATVVWQMEDDRHDGKASVDCEANANLITASPELFKAVNDFLNHFEGNIPLWLFEEAEAAVAKALGK